MKTTFLYQPMMTTLHLSASLWQTACELQSEMLRGWSKALSDVEDDLEETAEDAIDVLAGPKGPLPA